MGNKKRKDARRVLKDRYDAACNALLAELLDMWELDAYYGYWVGDDVGGIYDYDGGFTISMEDIIYCVEHDVTRHQYMEWQDYTCNAAEFNMTVPNLRSWMMGCPRADGAVFERLRSLKEEFLKAVDDENSRIRQASAECGGSFGTF